MKRMSNHSFYLFNVPRETIISWEIKNVKKIFPGKYFCMFHVKHIVNKLFLLVVYNLNRDDILYVILFLDAFYQLLNFN